MKIPLIPRLVGSLRNKLLLYSLVIMIVPVVIAAASSVIGLLAPRPRKQLCVRLLT